MTRKEWGKTALAGGIGIGVWPLGLYLLQTGRLTSDDLPALLLLAALLLALHWFTTTRLH